MIISYCNGVKMTKEKSFDTKEITRRLDVIIYLLLKQTQQEGTTAKQLIKELADMGLKDFEIARIFGKSRSYISSALTKIKKSSKGGKNV